MKKSEAGFSMVEALIAAAILLIIAIGMIPLFARSMVNNTLGSDYTQASTYSKSNLEVAQKMPFETIGLTLTTGTSLQTVNYVGKTATNGSPVSSQDWTATLPSTPLVWTRTTRVRQFSVAAIDDGVLSDSEALPAGTDPKDWQIKEISSVLDSGKRKPAGTKSPLAAIGQTTFQYMKAY
jgi:Tfp pilus assembly protein PilV